ncbi:MAG TPA: hypothetical protein VM869_23195 [Enhygromyxa sp.]|nr:hypothetical protein [Enhygromyxa sp.]
MARSVLMLALALALGCGAPPGASDGETSTESGDGSTESGETSFETFVMDGPDLPASCDPFAQDCPDGEKCVPYASVGGSWDANKCVPILGDGATGQPCVSAGKVEATDDCDASGVCWNYAEVDGELVGFCQPFCVGTPDNAECPAGWHCQLYGDGSRTICELRCDPLAQDCAEGFGCYWMGNEFWCALTTANIPAGEPCGYFEDCAPGHLCLSARVFPSCAGSACCTSYCDVGLGDGQCDAVPGTECVAFFEEAPVGQENVGYCGLP